MSSSSATAPPSKDALVLESINRLGIGLRDTLRVALGVDPNNVLARLMARELIQSVPGLPQNRSYYLPAKVAPLGAQALSQRLAINWACLVQRPSCIRLADDELQSIFGLQVPSGVHVFEELRGGGHRVLQVYVPETVEVVPGIVRAFDKARSFPRVQEAMARRSYGFLVLLPWQSGIEEKLDRAIRGDVVPGFSGLLKMGALATLAHFEVGKVPSPDTLSLAIKSLGMAGAA